MKNRIQMGIGAGGPTIIMIFVVLCLTTLGTLSLVTANADMKLTLKTAESIRAFYIADNLGEDFLAEVDSALKNARNEQDRDFTLTALKNLSAIPGLLVDNDSSDFIQLSYNIRIDEARSLLIQLEVTDPVSDPLKRYRIMAWKVVSDGFWNYEDFEIEFEDIIIPQ